MFSLGICGKSVEPMVSLFEQLELSDALGEMTVEVVEDVASRVLEMVASSLHENEEADVFNWAGECCLEGGIGAVGLLGFSCCIAVEGLAKQSIGSELVGPLVAIGLSTLYERTVDRMPQVYRQEAYKAVWGVHLAALAISLQSKDLSALLTSVTGLCLTYGETKELVRVKVTSVLESASGIFYYLRLASE